MREETRRLAWRFGLVMLGSVLAANAIIFAAYFVMRAVFGIAK